MSREFFAFPLTDRMSGEKVDVMANHIVALVEAVEQSEDKKHQTIVGTNVVTTVGVYKVKEVKAFIYGQDKWGLFKKAGAQ